MKIFITGSRGQVGSELAIRANALGYETIAVDIDELDITSQKNVQAMLVHAQPDVVINAAAYTAVDRAEEDQDTAFLVNRDGPKHIAMGCSELVIPLLHISTDYVFDGKKRGAYTEEDTAKPIGVYGQSKWEGDEAVRNVLQQHIILRVSWVFGRQGTNFVKTMLRVGKERSELRVVDDQFGCPSYAGDIADALLVMAKQAVDIGQEALWGTYHFCNTPETSWYQFAETIFSEAKKSNMLDVYPTVLAIPSEEYPTPVERPKNSVLDCDKIESKFGIVPRPWLDGLRETLGSYCD